MRSKPPGRRPRRSALVPVPGLLVERCAARARPPLRVRWDAAPRSLYSGQNRARSQARDPWFGEAFDLRATKAVRTKARASGSALRRPWTPRATGHSSTEKIRRGYGRDVALDWHFLG